MANINSNTIVSTIVKILIVSLLVGFALTLFDVTPKQLLANLGGTVQSIFEVGVSMVEWAVPYILLGAVVVVPIWIVVKLWGVVKNRS
jgi:hypothetical protein